MDKKKRGLSLFLAIAMLFGFIPFIEPKNVQAEADPTQPYMIANHPANASIDETTVTSSNSKTNWNNVQHPIVNDVYVMDTEIVGRAEPNADIYLNGTKKTSSGADGQFKIEISSAKDSDVFKLYAVKDGKHSPTTSVSVLKNDTPKGRQKNTIVVSGTSLLSRGLKEDDNGKYYEVYLDTYIATEPWFALGGGKMFYQVDERLAPYVKEIELIQHSGKKGTVTKMTPEEADIPGASNIWTSALLTSKGGPIRTAFIGDIRPTYKIYLKEDIPQEMLFDNYYTFKTWGRFKSGKLVKDFSKNIYLYNAEGKVYGPDDFFRDLDSFKNPGPVVDKANFDFEKNEVTINYSVNGSTSVGRNNRRPYNLQIKMDPTLAGLIDTVQVDGKNLTFENLNGTLVINDIMSPGTNAFLAKNIKINRQDQVFTLKLKDNENLSSLITARENTFDFELAIYDSTKYVQLRDPAESEVKKISEKAFKGKLNSINLKTEKKNLQNLIDYKKNTARADFTSRVHVDESITTNAIKNLSVAEILRKISVNPHPLNIAKARTYFNGLAYDNLGGDYLSGSPNLERINQFLNAAEAVFGFVESPLFNDANDRGLRLTNTAGISYVDARDSDQDGIIDLAENDTAIGTGLSILDTDGDGIPDGQEVFNNTDPLVAPFNWYDKDGNPITELSKDTTEISGKIGNNSSLDQTDEEPPTTITPPVQPRRVELWKLTESGHEVIQSVKSIADELGSFKFDFAKNTLEPGNKIQVAIFTEEVKGKEGKDEVVLQQAYEKPELSSVFTVIEQITELTVDNADQFSPDFTYVQGTADPNSEVTITFPNKSTITVLADGEGKFKAMIADAEPESPVLVSGDKFQVVAKALGKSSSDPVEVEVKGASEPPIINPFNKQGITKVEILDGDFKLDYKDGERFDPSGIKVQLTDNHNPAMTVKIGYDEFAEYGLSLNYDINSILTEANDHNKEIIITVDNEYTAGDDPISQTTGKTLTVKRDQAETYELPADYKYERLAGQHLYYVSEAQDLMNNLSTDGHRITAITPQLLMTEDGTKSQIRVATDLNKAKDFADGQPTELTVDDKATSSTLPVELTFENESTKMVDIPVEIKGQTVPGLKVTPPEGEDNEPVVTLPDPPVDYIGPWNKQVIKLRKVTEQGDIVRQVEFSKPEEGLVWNSTDPAFKLTQVDENSNKFKLQVGVVERYIFAGTDFEYQVFDLYNNRTNKEKISASPIVKVRGITASEPKILEDTDFETNPPVVIIKGVGAGAPAIDSRINAIQFRFGDRVGAEDLPRSIYDNFYKDANGQWQTPNEGLGTIEELEDGSLKISFKEKGAKQFAGKDLDVQGLILLENVLTSENRKLAEYSTNNTNVVQIDDLFPGESPMPTAMARREGDSVVVNVEPDQGTEFKAGDIITIYQPGEPEPTVIETVELRSDMIKGDGTVDITLASDLEYGTDLLVSYKTGEKQESIKNPVNWEERQSPQASVAISSTHLEGEDLGKTIAKVSPGEGTDFKVGDKIYVTLPGTSEPTEYTVGEEEGQLKLNDDGTVAIDLGNELANGSKIKVSTLQEGYNKKSIETRATVHVNKDKLAETIDQAGQEISPEPAEDSPEKAFNEALKEAKKVQAKTDASQKEIDQATKALNEAMKNVPVQETPTIEPINEGQKDIKISNIDGKTDKVEVKGGDPEEVLVTLVKDEDGNWIIEGENDGFTLTSSTASEVVITPTENANVEGKIITATASNGDTEGKTSEPVDYDTIAPSLTIKQGEADVTEPIGVTKDAEIDPIKIEAEEGSTVEVTNLPPDLTYNEETKSIEGKPRNVGTFIATVVVTDEAGNKTEQAITFDIGAEESVSSPTEPVQFADEISSTIEKDNLSEDAKAYLVDESGHYVRDSENNPITGTIDDSGNIKIEIPTDMKDELDGKTVKVRVTDGDKKPGDSDPIVLDTKGPEGLTFVEDPVLGDKTVVVSGPGEDVESITVTVKPKDPEETSQTITLTKDENGDWKHGDEVITLDGEGNLSISVDALGEGSKVVVSATDSVGNQTDTTKTVMGKSTPPSKVTIRDRNGITNLTIDPASETPFKNGDKISVTYNTPSGEVTKVYQVGTTASLYKGDDGNFHVNIDLPNKIEDGTDLQIAVEEKIEGTNDYKAKSDPLETRKAIVGIAKPSEGDKEIKLSLPDSAKIGDTVVVNIPGKDPITLTKGEEGWSTDQGAIAEDGTLALPDETEVGKEEIQVDYNSDNGTTVTKAIPGERSAAPAKVVIEDKLEGKNVKTSVIVSPDPSTPFAPGDKIIITDQDGANEYIIGKTAAVNEDGDAVIDLGKKLDENVTIEIQSSEKISNPDNYKPKSKPVEVTKKAPTVAPLTEDDRQIKITLPEVAEEGDKLVIEIPGKDPITLTKGSTAWTAEPDGIDVTKEVTKEGEELTIALPAVLAIGRDPVRVINKDKDNGPTAVVVTPKQLDKSKTPSKVRIEDKDSQTDITVSPAEGTDFIAGDKILVTLADQEEPTEFTVGSDKAKLNDDGTVTITTEGNISDGQLKIAVQEKKEDTEEYKTPSDPLAVNKKSLTIKAPTVGDKEVELNLPANIEEGETIKVTVPTSGDQEDTVITLTKTATGWNKDKGTLLIQGNKAIVGLPNNATIESGKVSAVYTDKDGNELLAQVNTKSKTPSKVVIENEGQGEDAKTKLRVSPAEGTTFKAGDKILVTLEGSSEPTEFIVGSANAELNDDGTVTITTNELLEKGKQVKVAVAEKIGDDFAKPSEPLIAKKETPVDSLTEGDTTIKVTLPSDAETGDKIVITIPSESEEGEDTVITLTKGEEGWSTDKGTLTDEGTLNLPDGIKVGTDPVRVVSEDKDGGATAIEVTPTALDQTDPPTDVEVVKEGDKYVVKGKAPEGTSVELKQPDGNSYDPKKTIVVDSTGEFSFDLPEDYEDGNEVEVTAKSEGERESNPATATVDMTSPTINEPEEGATVEGTKDTAITPIAVSTDDVNATITVDGLPDGVSYNEDTGKIEGTPTEAGEFEATIKVKDPAGNETTRTINFTIEDTATPDQADKTALQVSVDKDGATKASDVYKNAPADKKQAYDNALAKANTVLAKEDASQDEVNRATKALDDARSALSEVDKSELEESVRATNNAKAEDKYKNASPAKKQALDDALTKAEEILAKEDATQAEIDGAKKALDKAVSELDGTTAVEVEKEDLQRSVDEDERTKDSDAYKNADSTKKDAYDQALAKAKEVLAKEDTSQEEVDAARNALDNARQALDGGPTNRDDLKTSIDLDPTTKDTDKYKRASDESKQAYDNALTTAERVYNNPKASQGDVDAAKDALDRAREALDGEPINKDHLNTSIEDAKETKDTDKYKNASDDKKQALDNALTAAERVYNNPDVSQDDVDNAKNTLDQAIADLDGQAIPDVDKEGLQTSVDLDGEVKDSDSYKNASDQSKSAYDTALAHAKAVLADDTASQDQVDAAKNALDSARNNLDGQPTNKDDLVISIDEAKLTKDKDKYNKADPDKKQALDDALAHAEGVYANPNASQADIDQAKAALDQAIDNLNGKVVNKAPLKLSIDSANMIKAYDKYKDADPDKKQALDKALAHAETVYADPNASQADVDQAKVALDKALSDLNGESTADVDKTGLLNSIKAGDQAKQGNKYHQADPNRKAVLDKALADAKAVYNDPNATQAQVNAAKAALDKAIANLGGGGHGPKPRPKPSDDNKKPVGPDTPDKPEVEKVIKYVNGYPDGTFRPEGDISRAEAAAMFARLLTENNIPEGTAEFPDTVIDEWYDNPVAYLVDRGYMEGYEDGLFRPHDQITRAEFAQMVHLMTAENDAIAPFEDVNGHWSEEAINRAYGNEILKGYPDGSFKPDQSITRAEAVVIFNRLFTRYTEEPDLTSIINREELITFRDVPTDYWAYYEIIDAANTRYQDISEGNNGDWIEVEQR